MATEKKYDWRETQTVEAAFKWKGLDLSLINEVSPNIPEEYKKHQIASWQLPIIVEAINDGWVPDYTTRNQPKYELWIEIAASSEKPSGFGFSAAHCDFWRTRTGAGSRLAYETREKGEHCFKYFQDLLKDYYLM